MADLKTNYVDDVLDTSVNVKRKYNMIQNADGTVSFDDVTTYTQNGDSFGAKDINDTNAAVNELNSNLNKKQDKLTNPLTQTDVVNNLTSTSTVKPLSAYQGKVLNDKLFEKSRIAVVTGNMPSSESPNVTWLDYPEGFTRDNCIIIGFIHLDASGAIYRNDTLHCRAELRTNNITLYSDGDESVRYNTCKVVLYKYI